VGDRVRVFQATFLAPRRRQPGGKEVIMKGDRKTQAATGNEQHQLLTVQQAAAALATSQRTIWRLIGQGELIKVQVGRSVRITQASISAFVARGGAK
jgi:excisionase family DNA binding protein